MAAKKGAAKKVGAKKGVAQKGAAKKAVSKKVATKKGVTKKSVTKKAPAKKAVAIKDKYSKTQILTEIAENTGLSRMQVSSVFEELGILIERHIKKRSCGEFTLPGLLKIVTKKKPAQKARKGVPNPFRPGELMDVPAKPASIQVKVRPLKKLKEFAAY